MSVDMHTCTVPYKRFARHCLIPEHFSMKSQQLHRSFGFFPTFRGQGKHKQKP